jgi:hypothetical protein
LICYEHVNIMNYVPKEQPLLVNPCDNCITDY